MLRAERLDGRSVAGARGLAVDVPRGGCLDPGRSSGSCARCIHCCSASARGVPPGRSGGSRRSASRSGPPHPQSRSPLLLAWLVATIGVLSVLDAMLPGLSSTQLAELSLARVSPVASALVAPLGLALILVARGLARCKRRAYHLGVLLLAGLAVLHELHRFDYGAIAAASDGRLARRPAPGLRRAGQSRRPGRASRVKRPDSRSSSSSTGSSHSGSTGSVRTNRSRSTSPSARRAVHSWASISAAHST